MLNREALDPNSQKTHYVIETSRRKRQKRELPASLCPFLPHTGEDHKLTKHRYSLYEKIWSHQLGAIQQILNSANDAFFGDLVSFVNSPFSSKLQTAFLGRSSNTANNLRTLDEFATYLYKHGNQHVRLVTLDLKECVHVKAAVRDIIKQVLEPKQRLQEEPLADFGDEGEPANGPAEEEDIEGEAADDAGDGGRISYDFGIVVDWVESYIARTNSAEQLRLVVVLQDSDAFENEVLNQLVHLLSVYSKQLPIKLVMALSSKGISDWVNDNITSNMRVLIDGTRLEAKNNKDICFQVIDDILLRNEITSENPLLLDAQLSLIVLNRFENSNNSIDSLITEFKLTYMIHFYQLPLSILADPSFVPQPFHYEALRKLPSFKTHVEFLLHSHNNFKKEGDKDEASAMAKKITELLSRDTAILELFRNAKMQLQKYQNAVMNAIHLIHFLSDGEKQKFQLYKLVTNNQLINSSYLSDVLKRVRQFDRERVKQVVDFLESEAITIAIDDVADEDILGLKRGIANLTPDGENLLRLLTSYLHDNPALNMKISDNLFNEVLTITGGINEMDKVQPKGSIEESYENLMIKLIRPRLKESLEMALDEPQRYLRNILVTTEASEKYLTSKFVGPFISKLYQVYKDAPVNINIWDFFMAFKLSLSKKDLIDELAFRLENYTGEDKKTLEKIYRDSMNDEKKWEKVTYGWFLQSSAELADMGFLREKSKGDYVEKLIWKNL